MFNSFVFTVLAMVFLHIVPNVKKKIEEYKACGYEIIFTRDTHPASYLETNEGKHLPVEHCIRKTSGWLRSFLHLLFLECYVVFL